MVPVSYTHLDVYKRQPIEDPVSKTQVDTLAKNAKDFGLAHFGMMDKRNGIIHVVGPERGLTLPGMTIVCGDVYKRQEVERLIRCEGFTAYQVLTNSECASVLPQE